MDPGTTVPGEVFKELCKGHTNVYIAKLIGVNVRSITNFKKRGGPWHFARLLELELCRVSHIPDGTGEPF